MTTISLPLDKSPQTLKNTIQKSSLPIEQSPYKDDTQNTDGIIRTKNGQKNQSELPQITYANYIGNNIDFNLYVIPKLKKAAKSYKIRSSGKKQEIIDRIKTFFLQTKASITIQTAFRSWMCRYIIRLRGKALHNRQMCVNDTDFCTMEPLDEIENDYFFSFTDDKKFTYGFNITSLIEMLKRNNKTNPYTREPWSTDRINDIVTIYNLSFIVCKDFSKINIPYTKNRLSTHNRNRRQINREEYSPIVRPITRRT